MTPENENFKPDQLLKGQTLADGSEISPDGLYRIEYACNEMRMSHWVCQPRIIRIQTGKIILDLWNETLWDGSSSFTQKGEIILYLRKYPGVSKGFEAKINPNAETFTTQDKPLDEIALSQLKHKLN